MDSVVPQSCGMDWHHRPLVRHMDRLGYSTRWQKHHHGSRVSRTCLESGVCTQTPCLRVVGGDLGPRGHLLCQSVFPFRPPISKLTSSKAFVASLISASATAQSGFVVDNPTVSVAHSATKGALSNLVLPTGVFSFVLIVVVAVTSLPLVRRKNFNTFYFIHVIFAALILISACLHASTNFYFLLPGLLLWVSDWVWRLRCSLLVRSEAIVEKAGNGWTRVTLPSHQPLTPNDAEKHETSSSSTSSPTLATYYVNFPTLSKMELHPFTAASPVSAEVGPVLLFRRRPERKKARQTKREFTWAVAAAAETSAEPSKLQVGTISSTPKTNSADLEYRFESKDPTLPQCQRPVGQTISFC